MPLPLLVALLLAAPPQTLAGLVVGVHDGDTITVLDDDRVQHRVRLTGIDAPELGQPFGRAARSALSEAIGERPVRVVWRSKDRYGRIVGDVFAGEEWINREMVYQGLAWQYVRFDRGRPLGDAELDAREAERGLWSDRDPVPPWEWRAKRESP